MRSTFSRSFFLAALALICLVLIPAQAFSLQEPGKVTLTPRTPIFNVANLAPGDVRWEVLTVSNHRETPTQTLLTARSSSAAFGRALRVQVAPIATDCASATGWGAEARLSSLHLAGSLKAGASQRYCLRVRLPRDIGNQLQGVDTAVSFDLVVD